jgi:hypothetical protein
MLFDIHSSFYKHLWFIFNNVLTNLILYAEHKELPGLYVSSFKFQIYYNNLFIHGLCCDAVSRSDIIASW